MAPRPDCGLPNLVAVGRDLAVEAIKGVSVRVLVVSDDEVEADPLTRELKRNGYDIGRVNTGADALLTYSGADLVLLDFELPDLDGLEVCRNIRSASDVPVITVTSRDSELDRVLGLQAGSDDCLAKPYGFRELIARIEAVMRRVRPRPTRPVVSHGGLRVDPVQRRVFVRDRPVNLTRKEFELLYLLVRQSPNVVTRKEIMSEVWADPVTENSRTIDTHVNSLRSKLGARSWIVTVRGVGVRLGNG